MEKLKMHSPNVTNANIERIKELFPNCVTESQDESGKLKLAIDFDQLRQELSDSIVEGPQERYHLNWPGKREALLTANAPIAKTLRPAPDESVDFENTQNLFIEGDNLEALKLLQETYLGKVKMIYIDPPYNTGKDFVYKDNFTENTEEFLKKSNQKDESGNRLVANTESNGRIHSDWLSMIYTRLKLAKNILAEDGIMFISIDDNEQSNLKKVCDEVFGESSFISTIHVQMSTAQGQKVRAAKNGNIVKNAEYILVYCKSGNKQIGISPLYDPANYDSHYSIFIRENKNKLFEECNLIEVIREDKSIIDELIVLGIIKNIKNSINLKEAYAISPKFRDFINKNSENIVRIHDTVDLPESFKSSIKDSLIRTYKSDSREYLVAKSSDNKFYQRIRLSDKMKTGDDFHKTFGPTTIRGDWWSGFYLDMGNVSKEGELAFNNGKKPIRLLKQLTSFVSKENDLVVDFFAGSSSTAHAVMQLNAEDGGNRKFIMVQLPEPCDEKSEAFKAGYKNIAEISKERIRRAGKKILEGQTNEGWNKDVGFRVLKVDSSNMADIYYSPDATKQADLLSSIDNIKPDRKAEDLLFQVLLDLGVDLSLPITKQNIQGKTVFFINQEPFDLVACFDGGITEELVKEIAKTKPLRAVFRDNGFVSDSVKINAEQIFKQISPSTDIKAI